MSRWKLLMKAGNTTGTEATRRHVTAGVTNAIQHTQRADMATHRHRCRGQRAHIGDYPDWSVCVFLYLLHDCQVFLGLF